LASPGSISDASRVVKSLLKGVPPSPALLPDGLLDAVAGLSSARGRVSKLMGFERLLVTLRHREPDRVPCCPIVAGGGRRLTGHTYAEFSTDPAAAAESFLAAFDMIGGEIVVPLVDLSVEAADFGQEMVYPENSTAHPEYSRPLVKDVDGYRKLRPVDFRNAERMLAAVKMLEIMLPRVGMRGVVGGFAFGPLGVLNMMRGSGEMFRDCVNHPAEVMAALDAITGVLVEYVEAQCDAGVIIVVLDTLFASYNGLSKELWEKIEGPFARQLAEAIRRGRHLLRRPDTEHGAGSHKLRSPARRLRRQEGAQAALRRPGRADGADRYAASELWDTVRSDGGVQEADRRPRAGRRIHTGPRVRVPHERAA